MSCLHIDPKRPAAAHSPTGKKIAVRSYHDQIDHLADELEERVIAWRHDLHQHPELAMREVRTAKIVAGHLRTASFDEVRTHVGGTGVVGVLTGDKPGEGVIGLRADMDALPVKELVDVPFASRVIDEDYPGGPFPVMHACGHETHVAMLMGAAEILAKMRHQISGTVKLIFQPAEEGPPVGEEGGAERMIKEGALKNPEPDCIFGVHIAPTPVGTVAYQPGDAFAASELVKIEILGKQSHGSMPWAGLDPMPVAGQIITALAQIYREVDATEPITVSIGKIDDVGRFNIIGGRMTLWGTVRCVHERVMQDVNRRIGRIVSHIAQAYGLTAEATFDQEVPALHNDPAWLNRFLPTMERVLGHENLRQLQPVLGYDDVSAFIRATGGTYVILGGQDTKWTDEGLEPLDRDKPWSMNHNPHFYVNDRALKYGVRLHANIVMDYLSGTV